MPVSLVTWMYPLEDSSLPHPCSELLHAALFAMANAHKPAMAAALHDGDDIRPFALSTLWPRTRVNGTAMALAKMTGCRFRLSLLTEDAVETFYGGLTAAQGAGMPMRLGASLFKIVSTEMEEGCGAVPYDALPMEMERAVLRFLSPTTFRRAGQSYPLPDPSLVYGSLWRKWQAFSTVPFPQDACDELLGAVALSRAALRTRGWQFARYLLTGFTGVAEFVLTKEVSSEARRLFGALSRFARYASVGLRTTMGLGQCVLLEEP
ncbi:MAG: hypothetical protein BWY76_00657 [bacterium ADurb.Bin429]|nr:MAG: hypothetical protein BWY76_00657 [bacterium ADurb.Bin429]